MAEQVVIESIFNVSKAVKEQAKYADGFKTIDKEAMKLQKQEKVFSKTLDERITTYAKINSRIEAYNALLQKQTIGSEKFYAVQKRLQDLQKKLESPTSKPKPPPTEKEKKNKVSDIAKQGLSTAYGAAKTVTSKIGNYMKSTLKVAGIAAGASLALGIGAAYAALGGITKAIPAIGQAFDSMKETITRNLFMPLAQEVFPIVMKLFNWVGQNRIVFVKLGTIFVQAFRLVKMAATSALNVFNGFYKAFQKAVGGGQLTLQKIIDYSQLFSLKIAFIIAFLEVKLESVFSKLGGALGFLWENNFKPFFAGILDGFTGSDGIFTTFEEFDEMLNAITNLFDELGIKSDSKFGGMKKIMKEIGKFVGEFLMVPFRAVFKTITLIVNAVTDIIYYSKKMYEYLSNVSPLQSLKKFMDDIEKKVKGFVDEMKKIGKSMSFNSLLELGSGFKDKLKAAIGDAWTEALNAMKETKAGKVATKVFDFIAGERASGGSVQSGKSYLVGEKGAEIFTPSTNGEIIPNNQIKPKIQTVGNTNNNTSSASDNRTINITINGGNNTQEILAQVRAIIENSKPSYAKELRTAYSRYQ